MAAGASFERPRAPARAQLLGFFRQHVGFVWGALTNVITTSLAFWVAPHAQLAHLMIIHLLGAVLISTRFGMAVSTFTAITGALAFDYYCIPPIFAFALPDPHSVITFAGMLVVALLVCWLNQGLRLQRAAARESEARTQALCELASSASIFRRWQTGRSFCRGRSATWSACSAPARASYSASVPGSIPASKRSSWASEAMPWAMC
jgi:K+-sensing histidine kinase KdpD